MKQKTTLSQQFQVNKKERDRQTLPVNKNVEKIQKIQKI
jgi:hypothetical protein